MAAKNFHAEYHGAVKDAIERSFEGVPSKAERRDAYYAAEARKAQARRDRDVIAFRFWVAECRRRLDAIGD